LVANGETFGLAPFLNTYGQKKRGQNGVENTPRSGGGGKRESCRAVLILRAFGLNSKKWGRKGEKMGET